MPRQRPNNCAPGITPKQAEQWEKLGAVPDDEFEDALADHTTMPTTVGTSDGSPKALSLRRPGGLKIKPRHVAMPRFLEADAG
jgi:hypothetical protein